MTETLEEAAEKYRLSRKGFVSKYDCKKGFIDGIKWQAERSYSEEEVYNLLKKFKTDIINNTELGDDFETLICDIKTTKWFEQFKKK